jgi:hypothetical protein
LTTEQKRLAAIERILTYLSLCDELELRFSEDEDEDEDEEKIRFRMLPLTYFNRCEPISHCEELGNLPKSYQRFIPADAAPRDVDHDEWDVSWFTNRITGNDTNPTAELWKDKKAIYGVQRIRRVALSEIRGRFKLKSGMVIELAAALIHSDGTYTSSRFYAEQWGSSGWYVIGQPGPVIPELLLDHERRQVEISLGYAYARHFDWQVEIGYTKMPTIALTVDPPAARTVFKLRDLPPGKDRREALKHWVGEHYRHQSSGDSTEELIKIWPYLRGGNQFKWHGMECRIHPSRHDLIRAKKYEEYRAIQRQQNQQTAANRRKRK